MFNFARNTTISKTLTFQAKLNNEHFFYYQTLVALRIIILITTNTNRCFQKGFIYNDASNSWNK